MSVSCLYNANVFSRNDIQMFGKMSLPKVNDGGIGMRDGAYGWGGDV